MSDALKDLAIVPVTSSDTNYFLRKVTGLKIDKTYSFKFQWVLEDGTLSDWSPGYQIVTPTENVPGAPAVSVPSTNASHIPVTLTSFPANAKRVDIYIIGGDYGTGKVADSFLQAGTKTIAAKAGTYQVSLITVTPSGINGDPTNTFTILITDPTANIQTPAASVTPSIPVSKSVLGAIQVTWDGKRADGSDQPYGFDAAKVYVGTTAGFTPSASNQVDVFNFKNGQNIINIGVGTLVNGVAMTYGVDYFVKIATTNGTDTSTPVSAAGNPKQIGKAGSGDIVSILADQIETGTLSASSTITVGTTLGKHIKLAGTGDPLTIYGSGGVANPVLSYNGNRLTIVGDGTFSGNLSAAGGTFSGNISGASGTFTGGLSVGQGTVGIVTGAIGDGTKVTYNAINSLVVGDTVTISGIANNGPFVVPDSNPVQYYYTGNAYNITNAFVTDVTPTTFKVSSGVQNNATQSYTSGGTVTGIAFRVLSSGIFKAFAGNIGGWQIDATQIRSSGTNYISLNPLTPKIALVQSGVEKITIDPIEGIKSSTGSFVLSPTGNLSLQGSINSGSTITGADITMTGAGGQTGLGSTKLLFQASNYAISAGSSSYTYPSGAGSYDADGEWISSGGTTTVSNNDVRFTDATKAGAIPGSTEIFSYGEMWIGSGSNQAGTIDLFANYPGGYIGISLVADKTTQNIIIRGPSAAGFETLHRSSSTDASKESPAMLQVDSGGRLTRGRSIYSGGSSAPSATIGLQGDLYFSTAT